jgi:uncharacterized SAM-binding protein YcdF (DUF218 family)
MKRRTIKIWGLLVSTLLTLVLVWGVAVLAVLGWGSLDNATAADAIVVLGAAQYAGKPSPVLKARLDHALELWQRGLSHRLILTGGKGTGDTTSEAAVGRVYAERHGVPDSAILLETGGRTTRESMQTVARIMESKGLRSAILVSDPFHMLRLWITAQRFGIIPYTSPTLTSPISPNREQRWKYILGESVKVPAAFFFERTW